MKARQGLAPTRRHGSDPVADERLFDDEFLRVGIRALAQPEAFQDCLDIDVEGKAAADHAGYGQFKFAASHSKYIHDAIRKAGQAGAPFHGFRLFEHKPQVGDLVARSREGAISFEQAAASDAFKSHADIIVAVHADAVLAIGGNVSDSVSVARYAKTDSGHLSDAGGTFALLVNKV